MVLLCSSNLQSSNILTNNLNLKLVILFSIIGHVHTFTVHYFKTHFLLMPRIGLKLRYGSVLLNVCVSELCYVSGNFYKTTRKYYLIIILKSFQIRHWSIPIMITKLLLLHMNIFGCEVWNLVVCTNESKLPYSQACERPEGYRGSQRPLSNKN